MTMTRGGPLDAWRVAADGFLAVIGRAFVVFATVATTGRVWPLARSPSSAGGFSAGDEQTRAQERPVGPSPGAL